MNSICEKSERADFRGLLRARRSLWVGTVQSQATSLPDQRWVLRSSAGVVHPPASYIVIPHSAFAPLLAARAILAAKIFEGRRARIM